VIDDDDDDVARWQAEFERLDRGDVTLTLFMATFAATGRKPSCTQPRP